MKEVTVEEYVRALDKMKKNHRDRVGILGELGATGLGLTAGIALSGTIAGAVGVSTLAGSTVLASVLGGVLVTATPVGWVLASAAAGGALVLAAAKMIRSGEKCDMLKELNIREIEERIKNMRQEALQTSDHEAKMPKVITSIQHLVANSHMTQEKATALLSGIEKKQINVNDAFQLLEDLVSENNQTK